MRFLFLMLFSAIGIAAQPKPQLYEEYGRLTCEDILARTESFGQRLAESPETSAVVVGFNPSGWLRWQQQFVRNVLISRNGNNTRVRFFEATGSGEEPRSQFWLVPPGASLDVSTYVPTLSIPFIPSAKLRFGTDPIDPCSYGLVNGLAAVLTTTNAKALIVFVNYSSKTRLGLIAQFRRDLTKRGIDLGRVRFRYRSTKTRDTTVMSALIEYWLIPGIEK